MYLVHEYKLWCRNKVDPLISDHGSNRKKVQTETQVGLGFRMGPESHDFKTILPWSKSYLVMTGYNSSENFWKSINLIGTESYHYLWVSHRVRPVPKPKNKRSRWEKGRGDDRGKVHFQCDYGVCNNFIPGFSRISSKCHVESCTKCTAISFWLWEKHIFMNHNFTQR